MIPEAPLFKKKDEFDTYIDEVNTQIRQFNKLIRIYNAAPIDKRAEALMQVRQQLLRIDAHIGGFQTVSGISIGSFEYPKFYQDYQKQIRTQYDALGGPGYSEQQINQWELKNCKISESIPSALLFEKETTPGMVSSWLGSQRSTQIKRVTDLLDELSPTVINSNTEEAYYQLCNFKEAVRELIAAEPISEQDREVLNNLIARVNNRLFDIVANNPKLRSKVYPPESTNLAQAISNLSYQDAQKITNVLVNPQRFDEENFHRQFDQLIPGLDQYTIKFLGGVNAKNYKIENKETGEQVVLKITPNKGNNKVAYEHLKTTSARTGIADIYASISAIPANDGFMYSLELTEFCTKGDVLSHGLNIQERIDLIQKAIDDKLEKGDALAIESLYRAFGFSDKSQVKAKDKLDILAKLQEEQVLTAIDIYSQMTNILLKFQENNVFFPDAKPPNFLLNQFGEVLIADTKTFVKTKNGLVDPSEVQKNGFLLYSPGFRSPQFERGDKFSADKEHAYVTGISLYCYITGTDITKVPRDSSNHANFLDFDKPVFKTPKGKELKALIEGLTKLDANQRLSMHQVKDAFNVIQRGIKVEKSPFKSKTEAYFYALHNVMEIAKTTDNPSIRQAISTLKILIANHEQDPKIAAHLLNNLATILNDNDQKKLLTNIASAIENSAYEQTLQEKYENPLARRFESEMQIALLTKPTDKMMTSVGQVSNALLNVFEQIEQKAKDDPMFKGELEKFASNLTSGKEKTGFGSQPQEINIAAVKQILKENKPENLNQILYIHFLFAQQYMRYLPESIKPPNQRVPTGKMLELVKAYNQGEYKDNPADFFNEFDSEKLKYISDRVIYGSTLFTADPTRGREGGLGNTFSSQMGVMLVNQNQQGLGVDPSHWTPDSKYQAANLSAPFTRDLIENDAVYAAGPSGMTSLFLGIMENYGNFATVEEKQHYLTAVSAYMVSGGLHSLHEVLGPAQYALDLIPGYRVSPPDQHLTARPPNFYNFYFQQMELDPQFSDRYERGWNNMMAAYAQQKDQFVHAPVSTVSNVQKRVIDTGPKGKEESRYAEVPEDRLTQMLEQDPSLRVIKIGNISPPQMPDYSKYKHIDRILLKMNVHYLKGDQAKLDYNIKLLFKTVCKTRGGLFQRYTTSTQTARTVIDQVSKDPVLREIFSVHGDNPEAWKKEIETKMEATFTDQSVPEVEFSVIPKK